MADIKELSKSVMVTYGLIVAWSVLLVAGTWAGASIYFEFEHLKREAVRIEFRFDKITKRNAEASKINSERITTLELPNSDE